MTTQLSIMASYDEIVRCSNILLDGSCEKEFHQFAMNQEEMRQKWLSAVLECQRLAAEVSKVNGENSILERQLHRAKLLFDMEKRSRKLAEEEKKNLELQITMARDLLVNDGKKFNDETREKLQSTLNGRFSNVQHKNFRLHHITELDSTASILSDISNFSRSEDDLDTSIIVYDQNKRRGWKEHRPSGEYRGKKRRSSQRLAELNNSGGIIATTTVTVPKEGTITASSVIEAVPVDENKEPHTPSKKKKKSLDQAKAKIDFLINDDLPAAVMPSAPKADLTSGSESDGVFKPSPNIGGYTWNTKLTPRGHSFTAKTVIKPEMCLPCGKRIRFGKVALKCRDCRATTHSECKELVPLPCIGTGNTPTLRGASGIIADYTPLTSPMVPSLVVHCINEVELRGMNEQGLYRISGGASEVKSLKEKFLRGKGAPNLSGIDIHTICSTLKDFLRSLKEPLITASLWGDFARATAIVDKHDADAALYQAISELPPPNRDTLAFLILHLQRVSSSPECKMPIANLAKVFGPTLVGYSCHDPSPTSMLDETKNQVAIVDSLLKIPSDYWANFVSPDAGCNSGTPNMGGLRHTPSTESLFKRHTSRGMFTPLSSSRTFLRKKRYFASPSKAAF